MRKSILRFGALALMSMMSIGSWAQIFTVGNNNYKVISPEAKTVALASATADMPENGIVQNPGNLENYRIIEVADFAYVSTVQSGIKIPSTVTKVGSYAFAGQTIKNTSLSQIESIGEYAFKGATFTAQDVTFEIVCDLPEGVFYNATFGTATRIKLSGCTSGLNDKVFALSDVAEDDGLVSVELAINSIEGFTSVGKETFKNRTNLAGFGYRSYQTYFLPAAFTTVGDNAFEGCSSLKLSFYVQAENARITNVGKEGFKNCKLFDDTMFANTCRSFAGLTYGEGSFQGCALKNIDLTESNVTGKYGMNGVTYYDGIIVPKNAFKDNISGESASITSIKLPANCVAIQEGAFENNALQTIELPEGIEHVEKNALAAKNIVTAQPKLFLPKTLEKIGLDALKNREFTAVYAHPEVTGSDVPSITGAPTIIATYVPAAVPFTIGAGQSATNYDLKSYYVAQGWTTATYACQFTNSLSGGNYILTDSNVQYSVEHSLTGAFDDNGCIKVKAAKFTADNPVIKGYIETNCLSDDQDNPKNHSLVVTDGLQTPKYSYTYPIVLHVNSFEGLAGTYKPSTNVTKKITKITFSPKDYVDAGLGKASSLASTAAYTDVPAIFSSNTDLESVTLKEGLTTISESAFSGTTKLTNITLPSTLTTVCASAFKDGGLTAITLPRSVNGASALGPDAFNTASLKTVNVSYDKETSGLGKCPIPTATGVFKNTTTHLVVVSGGTATREDYLLATGWSQFFDDNITVKVKKHVASGTPTEIQLATKDVEGIGAAAGTWTQYYELEDAGDIHTVSIAVTNSAEIPVHYKRSFTANVPNAWYVPFDYQYDSSKDLDVKFYYIYDTKQTGEDANAGTSIELKEVKLTEGKATIKANTPYVVVPTVNSKTFIGGNIKDNQAESFDNGSLSVQNVVNTYTFTGTYVEAQTVGQGTEESPYTRYQIYANNGGKLQPVGTNSWIPAYRFYLDIAKRSDGDANPYGLVKFVFLDEEDATGIKDVNAETIANGAMFDLMGRQIASPVKGQVYIQNGVKKLAK